MEELKFNIRYTYSSNKHFLLDINGFLFRRGDIIFLHGPSGCGKTTLLNIISGIIADKLTTYIRNNFENISYIMHESTLLPWKTISENLNVEGKLREKTPNKKLFKIYTKVSQLIN